MKEIIQTFMFINYYQQVLTIIPDEVLKHCSVLLCNRDHLNRYTCWVTNLSIFYSSQGQVGKTCHLSIKLTCFTTTF